VIELIRRAGNLGAAVRSMKSLPGAEIGRLRRIREEASLLERDCAGLREELDAEKAAAREEGFKDGICRAQAAAAAALSEAFRKRDEIIRSSRDEIMDFAFELARKVLRAEVERDPSHLARMIEEDGGFGGLQQRTVLRVNPEDLPVLSSRGLLPGDADVAADPGIPKGAVRIESGHRVAETGIDARLQMIKEGLIDGED
jgi:flagellar biosynthesis/type III secretory pathway protein FliH